MTKWQCLWITGLGLFAEACTHHAQLTDLCEIAVAPEKFVGRLVVVKDVIIADGHGDASLIPDETCPAFAYFMLQFHELPPPERGRLLGEVRKLNARTMSGLRPGLGGVYKIRVERIVREGVVSVSLNDFNGLQVVAAHRKQKSLEGAVKANWPGV